MNDKQDWRQAKDDNHMEEDKRKGGSQTELLRELLKMPYRDNCQQGLEKHSSLGKQGHWFWVPLHSHKRLS